MNENKKIPVASYTRFSSEGQNETSIEYQDKGIQQYCDRMGYEIVKKYSDKAFSATNDRRPDFQKMITDADNSPEWQKLIVYDFSRFSRNTSDAFKYRDYLFDKGIKIICSTMPFEDVCPETLLLEGIMFVFNDYFSRKLSYVTRDGLEVKARKGGHCGGRPPLGYDVQGDKLVVNEMEAEIVRRIFEMYITGVPFSEMAKILNSEHKRTKAGTEFKKNSFYSILNQEKYKGTFVWNRAKERDSKSRRNTHAEKPLEKQVRIENAIPSIVNTETFDKVQSIMKERKGKKVGTSKYHYMLNNLNVIKCASCGATMTGAANKSRTDPILYYACPNHRKNGCPTKNISRDKIEKLILAAILYKFLGNKTLRKKYNKLLNCTIKDTAIKGKLDGIDRAIENILGIIEINNTEQAQKRLKRLQAHKEELINKSLEDIKQFSDAPEEYSTQKKALKKLLKNSDMFQVRSFLANVIKSVTVGNDKVKVELKI